MMKALIVRKEGEEKPVAAVEDIGEDMLPAGEVTVAVDYSTVNYKDGLCIGPGGGLVRNYPHARHRLCGHGRPRTTRYKPGDKVVLTGWRAWARSGGAAMRKRRGSGRLAGAAAGGAEPRQAMAVGTRGLTAMLSVMALEDHGLAPGQGPVLVTGAAGGVGSVATAVLAKLGHEVAAVTGRPEQADYLKGLGASQIVAREDLTEVTRKPLEAEAWSGCVDAVAGAMLGRVLKQMKYGSSVAAVGLAGGAAIEGALITPFILRGVNLLGIDSVMQPYANRVRAWQRIAADLPMDKLESMIQPATLSDLPQLGRDILKGQVKGRVVVDVNA
ncbi:MAG: acryloyl-CoA reductase [Paracoccaceae bacterium]